MKYFNKEQIERLEDVKQYLHTVFYANYKRNTMPKENDIVADVLESIGESVKRTYSCAQCVYNMFMKCARIYYASIERLEKIETTTTTEFEETTTTTIEETTTTTILEQTEPTQIINELQEEVTETKNKKGGRKCTRKAKQEKTED